MANKNNKTKTVAIIGLGYVGLPLAILCSEKKYKTFGIDSDAKKVELINKKISPVKDRRLAEELKRSTLKVTTDFSILIQAKVVIVCVPTPVNDDHTPDFNPLINACEQIKKYLQKGQLIIIESTINPGVCEEVVAPILEKSGMKLDNDFYLAHCPERIDPGNIKYNVKNIPRVVGGTSPAGLSMAVKFYKSILNAEVKQLKNIKSAEAAKIIENTFRDINIAYINELAMSFDKLGIDILEVIDAAATKPFAFMPHYPGCGIGGHCIPVDPYYLIERADKSGFNHRFLKLARDINNNMPAYTVKLLIKELGKIKKSIHGAKIGILGVAYKADLGDTRESPSFVIINTLKKLGAKLVVFDPFVQDKSNVSSIPELLKKSEALILTTAHKEFRELDLKLFKRNHIRIVIDGRNCLDKKKIVKLGIVYKGIGH